MPPVFSAANPSAVASQPFDIVVVGGGFSGLMVAVNAAALAAPERPRIAIVARERADAIGRGVAYATAPCDAILNVPAGLMGAFPDRPGDFVRWLRACSDDPAAIDPGAYYPRSVYGSYLASLLAEAEAAGADITRISADIVDVERGSAGLAVIAADGRAAATGAQVVLAIGGTPPADPLPDMRALRGHPGYVADPWVFLRQARFAPAGDILVLGSGLTALDVIAAFATAAGDSRMCVISRRGRFPAPHAAYGGGPIAPIPPAAAPATMREIVTLVRAAIATAGAAGSDWRAVLDGLRPEIPRLWMGLDVAERRRFLRHVRALYDPHRHRAPAAQLAIKDQLRSAGRLSTQSGRLVWIRAIAGGLEAGIAPRGQAGVRVMRAAQIINCCGPANGTGDADALLSRLAEKGTIAADPSGLGLSALPDGRLIDATGDAQPNLYAIGWPMRGTLLESTAVRELREQAQLLAFTLIATMPVRALAARSPSA